MRVSAGRLRGVMPWLRWFGSALMVLAACLLGGLTLMLVLGSLGLDPNDPGDDGGYATVFFFFTILVPFTATAYLVLFALFGRFGRRPRVWAFVLLPVFWSFIPYFALFPWFPPTGAMWLSLLVFATFVEMPPYRRRQRDDPLLTAPERPLRQGSGERSVSPSGEPFGGP